MEEAAIPAAEFVVAVVPVVDSQVVALAASAEAVDSQVVVLEEAGDFLVIFFITDFRRRVMSRKPLESNLNTYKYEHQFFHFIYNFISFSYIHLQERHESQNALEVYFLKSACMDLSRTAVNYRKMQIAAVV